MQNRFDLTNKLQNLKKDDVFLLNANQITRMLSLVLIDGSYMLDMESDKSFVYQIMGQIYSYGFDDVFASLIDTSTPNTPIYDKEINVWLASPGLSNAQTQSMIILDIRKSKLDVGEGIYTCGKCSSTETIYFQTQTRSADEPMTTTVQCINCNHEFSG